MNRVITINLNGNAYQLEESGYDALRTYLDDAARRLEGNPDKDEITADIEQAIADKFRTVLGANKNVVMTKEVENVLLEMGPVQDSTAASEGQAAGASERGGPTARGTADKRNGTDSDTEDASSVKRLYAIREGAMLVGVCNGLAAYFNMDVTIVRILFVILSFFWGMGVLVYLVMALIIPTANTPAEKAAAYGVAATAQEFIRRAKAGYYEGMKSFHDKNARKEWKRKFKQDMRGWQHEIHRNAHQWQRNWQQPGRPSHYAFGPVCGAPFLGLVNAAIAIFAIFAIHSLVKTGVVYGLALPAGVPLWVGIVSLIVIWHLIAWPFKAMQWASSYPSGGGRCTGPFGAFGDFLFGIAVFGLVVWMADRFIPQFHDVMKQMPALLHHAIDSFQHWVEKR